jgi:ankyrin repeat protein
LGRTSLAATALVVMSACAVDTRDVTLSYQLRQDWCDGCDGYELKLGSGGHVWFTGLAGCAVPGSHHYRIPATDFDALARAFHDGRFFGIPRTGLMEIDAGVLVLTYRDRVRIHEVEDWARDDPGLRALERRVRATARPDRYLVPSSQLYEELLRGRWDVNATNENGWTALRCAVSRNRVDAVRTLLTNGARVADEDLLWAFGMDGAIRDGVILQLLVSVAGVDPRDKITPDILVLASAANDSTALRFLLQNGVNVDAVGRSGKSALTAAIDVASLPNVLVLLSHGADPNLRTGRDGETALHHAAVGNETGLVTLLNDHGAEIDSRDARGLTPLMHAATRCTYWNIGALLAAGADVRAAASDGRTAVEMTMPKITAETRREFSDNRKNCEMTRALLGRH